MNLKRKQAEYPYDAFWIYKVWHEKEGRWQANLIRKSDTKDRTTISYARYVMSVHLKRFLDTNTEHVDHINNDRSDDSIENLQILTPKENKLKQETLYRELNPKYVTLNCYTCGNGFDYVAKNFRFHTRQGRLRFHCSRKCAHESLRKKSSVE